MVINVETFQKHSINSYLLLHAVRVAAADK
jgi:hypothetical protein